MSFPEEPDILTGKALIHQRNALRINSGKMNKTRILPITEKIILNKEDVNKKVNL